MHPSDKAEKVAKMSRSKNSFGRITVLVGVLALFVGLSAVPAMGQLRRFRWLQDGCGPCQGIQQGCQCQSCQGCGQIGGPGQTMPGGVQPTPADPNNPNSATDPGSSNVDPSTQANLDSFAMSDQFGGGQGMGARDITIGDFFNNTGQFGGFSYELMGNAVPVNSPVAGGDRRYKVSDYFSPLPVNRVYVTYHNFDDPVNDVNGNVLDVHRYTMGIERTFWQDAASFEVRVPFIHGLNRNQTGDGVAGNLIDGTEFGNLTLVTKFLLTERCNRSWSAGMALTVPTADDATITTTGTPNPSGGPLVRIENEAYSLHPFMAWNVRPTNDTWITYSTQLDFNLEGNGFISLPGSGAETADKYNDQNLLSFDVSMGRWFYRDRCCSGRWIQGIAGIWELHYTTTINDTDVVQAGFAGNGDTFSNPFNRIDLLNTTAGLRFQLGSQTFVTLSGVAPLREFENRPFDAEFNLNVTRTY